MKILVLNGPNINMLGVRETDIYGKKNYADLEKMINDYAKELGVEVDIYQSNYEGDLVSTIQMSYLDTDGIIINPAAYTHTSIAILDALKGSKIPTIEVHISKLSEREPFRQFSYIREYAIKTIEGEGLDGYLHALKYLKEYLDDLFSL